MSDKNGFSLLELLIAVVIFSVILAGIYGVMFCTQNAYAMGITVSNLEVRARRAVDRIAEELQDAGVTTLILFPDPIFEAGSFEITFRRNTDYQGGTIVWGDPVRIALEGGTVVMRTDFGGPGEQTVTLTPWVREYLEGETANGADDNGNGLIDERGLSYELNGNVVVIRLTLEQTDEKGRVYTGSVGTSVRLRN